MPVNGMMMGFAVDLRREFESPELGYGLRLSKDSSKTLENGECAGIYMPSVGRLPRKKHRVVENGYDEAYSMVLRVPGKGAEVLYSGPGRCDMGSVNEGAQPNVTFVEVDIPLDDHDEGVVLACIVIQPIAPGDFLRTDYGEDYEPIRRLKGYKDPCSNRGPAPIYDGEKLAAAVRLAFGQEQLGPLVASGGAYSVREVRTEYALSF